MSLAARNMGTGAVPVLLLLAGTLQAEVVRHFNECLGFFQNKTPPSGLVVPQPVEICQMYQNHYHFATLYSRQLRIPAYSAYRYPCSLGQGNARRPSVWFCEPQIESQNGEREMEICKLTASNLQAVNSDYVTPYERGHLYPFTLNQKDSATSTCTLTNAVPKTRGANVRWYSQVELKTQKLAEICHKSKRSMYIVTGADISSNKKMNYNVSVPQFVWTAFCCTFPPDKNNDPCLDGDMGPEGNNVPVYNEDFSCAFMKQIDPENNATYQTVSQLETKLGNITIFNSCRGTSQKDEAQTCKEVGELIEKFIISADGQDIMEENSPPVPAEQSPAVDGDDLATEQDDTPLEPAGEEGVEGDSQSTIANVLAPIGRMISLVSNALSVFARLITTIVNTVRILAVTILRVPARIIHDCASCLVIMVKYLIVTVATVPQDILGIVTSIILDTASAISWFARLVKNFVRIL